MTPVLHIGAHAYVCTLAGDNSLGLSLPSLFLGRPVVPPSVLRSVTSPPSSSSTAKVTETLKRKETSSLVAPKSFVKYALLTLPVCRRRRGAGVPRTSPPRESSLEPQDPGGALTLCRHLKEDS